MRQLLLKKDHNMLFKKRVRNIVCNKGCIWISWKNGKDILLITGQSFDAARYRSVHLHALEEAIFEFEWKVRETFLPDLQSKLRGLFGKGNQSRSLGIKSVDQNTWCTSSLQSRKLLGRHLPYMG